MKIYLVEIAGSADCLVRAHTRAGAEKFVIEACKPKVTARVPTQDELVTALRDGVEIEDATTTVPQYQE